MGDPTEMDQRRRLQNQDVVAHDSSLMLCDRCNGTGNELFSMFRKCSACGGIGVVDREFAVEGADDGE